MGKYLADVIGCQYGFWRLIRKHAPEVVKDLFDRDRPRMWNIKEWDARWERFMVALDNPRGTGPHPAALAWCEGWQLPDWFLIRAEHALSAVPSRQLRRRAFKTLTDGERRLVIRFTTSSRQRSSGAGLCVNVCKSHHGFCETHKVFWPFGSGSFSSWQEEDEEI
jgi:hypothetical protein